MIIFRDRAVVPVPKYKDYVPKYKDILYSILSYKRCVHISDKLVISGSQKGAQWKKNVNIIASVNLPAAFPFPPSPAIG